MNRWSLQRRSSVSYTWLQYLTPLAKARSIDPLLVAALIAVESGGNPWAVRYESSWSLYYQPEIYARRYKHLGLNITTEKAQQRFSYGLLQIMGTVARERGCQEPFLSILTQPAVCLEFGLAHLAWLRDVRGWDGDDLLAAWRGGNPAREAGQYKHQNYVDTVRAAMQRIQEGDHA
jgi:hypothetical protein